MTRRIPVEKRMIATKVSQAGRLSYIISCIEDIVPPVKRWGAMRELMTLARHAQPHQSCRLLAAPPQRLPTLGTPSDLRPDGAFVAVAQLPPRAGLRRSIHLRGFLLRPRAWWPRLAP